MVEFALILGSKSDIARAIARHFASKGVHLQLAGRGVSEIETDAKDIALRYGVKAQSIEWDALHPEEHAAIWNALSPKPAVVICVAGFMPKQEDAQGDFEMQQRTLASNFSGLIPILEIAAGEFETQGAGTIIGISSVAGDRGRASNYLYGSAKAGFTAYLSGLRNRLAKAGAHVLTVKPGFVATRMTEGLNLPPLLTASPSQVARAVWKGYKRRKNIIYVKWFWRQIMMLIRWIPEFIFKKMKL